MYKILRNLLFFFPAEGVHHFSMRALKILCKWGLMKKLITVSCRPATGGSATTGEEPRQEPARELFGLRFRNPVGLGAGFDKNALYLDELEALGFGFVEIGTVTPLPQSGNEQPRLFRLPMDQALVNRMGFNNDGAAVIAERLKKWRDRQAFLPIKGSRPGSGARGAAAIPLIVGGNIGKNKSTPNEVAWNDYELCFRALFEQVDYFVVNVSSPNTPGLRELQEKDALRQILVNLQTVNKELAAKIKIRPRPLLLKIAPDLNGQQLDEVIALAQEIRLDGLVAANTSIGREKLLTPAGRIETIGAGGLSGAPLKERATAIVKYIQGKTGGSIPLIASGGIFTGADAKEKIQAGASLVQVWTGFIYEGPMIVGRICEAL
jgi:dihydroorotate dehydrogenase